jgi:hypothetical protein
MLASFITVVPSSYPNVTWLNSMPPLKRGGARFVRGRSRTRLSTFKHFEHPLARDHGLRDRVGHLRQIPHGLYILLRYSRKTIRTPTLSSREHSTRAVSQHEAGSNGHDNLRDRRQLGFQRFACTASWTFSTLSDSNRFSS